MEPLVTFSFLPRTLSVGSSLSFGSSGCGAAGSGASSRRAEAGSIGGTGGREGTRRLRAGERGNAARVWLGTSGLCAPRQLRDRDARMVSRASQRAPPCARARARARLAPVRVRISYAGRSVVARFARGERARSNAIT